MNRRDNRSEPMRAQGKGAGASRSHRHAVAVRTVFAVVLILAGVRAGAQTVDLNQITADDEFRWGVRSMHDGKINEAIDSLNRSLSFDSERPMTRYWLGRAYYFAGFEESALDEWNWVADHGGQSAVLAKWIERVRLSRGLTTERLGNEITPGRYVTMLDLAGKQNDLTIFSRPTMVRPREDGYFYVASFGTHTVVLLDPNGVRKQVIDGGIEGLDRPFDVLPLADGSLLVSEFGADRIAQINSNGFKTGSFGGTGVGDGTMLGPQFLADDGDGAFYVTDYGNSRVLKFTTDGEFLFAFGGRSGSFDGLGSPAGVVVLDGRVYVADSGEPRIVVFDESGNYLGVIRTSTMVRPEGLTRYAAGKLLLADQNRLFVIDAATEQVSQIAEIAANRRILGASIDANRNLLATDFQSSAVLVMAASEELYTGLNVEIDSVNAVDHPRVLASVTVTGRDGRPVLGLDETNFRITEDRFPTRDPSLVYAGYRSGEVAVAIVVDRSPALRDDADAIRTTTFAVSDRLGADDRLWIIGAGDQPVVAAGPSDGRLRRADAAVGTADRYGVSRIDLAVRLGVSQLLGEQGRRALVVVSDGERTPQDFENYSIEETARHLVNNHVAFSVVYTKRNATNPELDYLARTSGGESLYAYQPVGTGQIVDELRSRPSGTYVLEFTSVHDSDFGRRYIPLEIETYLLERSGRDEAGYFGPLEF